MVWIFDDRIVDGANLLARWRVVMAHALGAPGGIDFINVHAHGYGLIRTLGFAHIAIDTFMGDE